MSPCTEQLNRPMAFFRAKQKAKLAMKTNKLDFDGDGGGPDTEVCADGNE